MPLRHQSLRGFSLIELLIVIVISGIIAAAMASLFAESSKTRQQVNRTSERIENGRYALESIADDVRLAGFFGDLSPASNTTWSAADWATENPCAASLANLQQHWNAATPKLPTPVIGYETHGTTATAPSCLSNFKPSSSDSTKLGSDAIVVRRVSTTAVAAAAISGTAALQVSTQTSFCTSKDPNAYVISDTAGGLTLHRWDCTSTAVARSLVTKIYYIASCNICSGSGADTTPTLKVAELVNGAFVSRSLAPGIDQIHFEYGIDTTTGGDGGTDEYRLATNDGLVDTKNWADVMSVKIYVLAREVQENKDYTDTQTYTMGSKTIAAFNDHYKRNVLSTTVRLTNVSGRRELP